MRRVWRRPVAVLRGVCGGAPPPDATVVPSLRSTPAHERREVRGLSSGADRVGASGVRLPGTGQGRGPPAEVLRVARGGRGIRSRPGGARPAAGRRRDVGAAGIPAAGRARLRPGSRARAGARARAGSPRGRLRPSDEGDRSPGPPVPRGTDAGDGRCVRMHPSSPRAGSPPSRRRCIDDGRHGLGVRRSAPRSGSARDPSPHRLSLVHRPASRTAWLAPSRRPCLYSGVLPSGSVVARGQTPVVDASRGRNDPRKATFGRRAWSGLEVSPAPVSERGSGRGCESAVQMERTDRRRTPPQASVGSKTRSAGREHPSPTGRATDRRWI